MRFWNATAAVLSLLKIATAFSQELPEGSDQLSIGNASETLDERFRIPPVWREGAVQVDAPIAPLSDPSFSWAAGYLWDHPLVGHPPLSSMPLRDFPAWTSNGLAAASPNGDMMRRMNKKYVPLTWSETLNFTVLDMPSELAATVGKEDPKQYIGATISSFPYAQKYGVFAMSAKLPGRAGIWPAFWLLPANKSWPPEIDVMEVLGRMPSTLYTTVHTNFPSEKTEHGQGTETHIDLGAAFHEYAVDWGPEQINWYFDRKLVYSQPTPPDLRQPCYIIASLEAGKAGDWGGAPDSSSQLPATMQVAYIKVWQRPEYLRH